MIVANSGFTPCFTCLHVTNIMHRHTHTHNNYLICFQNMTALQVLLECEKREKALQTAGKELEEIKERCAKDIIDARAKVYVIRAEFEYLKKLSITRVMPSKEHINTYTELEGGKVKCTLCNAVISGKSIKMHFALKHYRNK